jgi:hypothetical protein
MFNFISGLAVDSFACTDKVVLEIHYNFVGSCSKQFDVISMKNRSFIIKGILNLDEVLNSPSRSWLRLLGKKSILVSAHLCSLHFGKSQISIMLGS